MAVGRKESERALYGRYGNDYIAGVIPPSSPVAPRGTELVGPGPGPLQRALPPTWRLIPGRLPACAQAAAIWNSRLFDDAVSSFLQGLACFACCARVRYGASRCVECLRSSRTYVMWYSLCEFVVSSPCLRARYVTRLARTWSSQITLSHL